MTNEYISRDETIEKIKMGVILGAPGYNSGLKSAIDIVRAIPSIDVARLKHSEWCQIIGESGVVRVRCKNCSFPRFPENDVRERMFNYCPCCGAKMDGGRND